LHKDFGLVQTNQAEMADALASEEWAMHAAGEDSKGLKLYEWARISLHWVDAPEFKRWILIRRNRQKPDQRAYFFVFAPKGSPLAKLAADLHRSTWIKPNKTSSASPIAA